MTSSVSVELLQKFAKLVSKSSHIVFFTGAGISVPSGIPDFRSENGVWSKYDPYTYASVQGFKRDPVLVWDFLKKMYNEVGTKEPNPAHYALTQIQEFLGVNRVTIITQNIDGLHQKAGSKNIIEFHGSFSRLTCLSCGTVIPTPPETYRNDTPIPRCPQCNKILKPDITFFGESPPRDALVGSQNAFQQSTVAIGVGTSLEVVPASLFFLQSPGVKALFNLEPVRHQYAINYYFPGDVSVTLPLFVKVLQNV